MTLQQVLVYKPFREKEGSSVHELSIPKEGQPETNRVYKKIRGKTDPKLTNHQILYSSHVMYTSNVVYKGHDT